MSQSLIIRTPARHQNRAIDRLTTWWRSRSKANAHGFLAMPTGSGKTFTAVRFAVRELLEKVRAPRLVWVAHSGFLLDQAMGEFHRQLDEAGLDGEFELAQVDGAGRGVDANVMFATIQTLSRGSAVRHITRAGAVDLVVFDEFHRLAAKTWRKVPPKFQRKTRTLGLSATPFRKSPAGTQVLRDILPNRVYSIGYAELVRDSFLADPTVVRVRVDAKRPVRLTGSERSHLRQFKTLNQSALKKIAKQVGRDRLIVRTYTQDPARFKSTIAFCCSVDHAKALARAFSKAGVPAESICGAARDVINQDKLEAFRRGEFSVATSVLLLTEGVDVPRCRSVFLARPTESPVLLTQMIGRAMRGPKAGGAKSCTIVDFVDNLDGNLDLSATHIGHLREREERVRKLVRRRPRKRDHGISMALLLRVREYMNQLIIEQRLDDIGTVIEEEIAGWLDHWDGEIRRVLLVPHDSREEILGALDDARNRAEAAVDTDPDPDSAAAEAARAAYDDHALDAFDIPEEDFVTMATAIAAGKSGLKFHSITGPNALQNDDRKAEQAIETVDALEHDIVGAGIEPDEFDDVLDGIREALRG